MRDVLALLVGKGGGIQLSQYQGGTSLNRREIRGLEQSPQTKPQWAQMARSGKKVFDDCEVSSRIGCVEILLRGKGTEGDRRNCDEKPSAHGENPPRLTR